MTFLIDASAGKVYSSPAHVQAGDNVSWAITDGTGVIVFWVEPSPVSFAQVIATPNSPAEGKVNQSATPGQYYYAAVVNVVVNGVPKQQAITAILIIDP